MAQNEQRIHGFLAVAISMEMAAKKLIAQESVREYSVVVGERLVSHFVDLPVRDWSSRAGFSKPMASQTWIISVLPVAELGIEGNRRRTRRRYG